MNIFANTIFNAGVGSRMLIMFQNCRFSINIFCILVSLCVIEITLLILVLSQACMFVCTHSVLQWHEKNVEKAAEVVYMELTSFGFLCSFLDIAKLIAFTCKKHVIKLCRTQSFPSFYITLPLRYHRCTLSHGRIFSLFASLLLRFCTFRYKGCNITK